jgi:hypothetical protein
MLKHALPAFASLIISGLAGTTSLEPGQGVDPPAIGPGYLVINEVMASGSREKNEFGIRSDWFEIHNPQDRDVILEAGRWSVTDKGPAAAMRTELPATTIPAGGYLLIWCDGMNITGDQIHAHFALSAGGEHLALIHTGEYGEMIVDEVVYGPQRSGISEGLDENGLWSPLEEPTPGRSNVPMDMLMMRF